MPAGRPKGSAGKNKQALLLLLQHKYPDYHPVLEMAAIAHDLTQDITLRANMHKEVSQYVVPKLKAMELSTANDTPLIVTQMVFPEK